MTSPADPEPVRPETGQSNIVQVRWWIAAVTFVAGAVLGIILTAVLIGTAPKFGTAPEGTATQRPDTGQPTGDSTVPVTAEARVNAACLRVINEAQDVVRILSGADDAATDVDLQRLDDIVRRLQPVQARLERDLRGCRVDTGIREGSTGRPASPVPTMPQPTPRPTR